jgi:sulfur carrier protein
MINIWLNGDAKDVKAMNLLALLDELGLDGRKLAIELNYEIVPRHQYQSIDLKKGDRLEIVHFVGGG